MISDRLLDADTGDAPVLGSFIGGHVEERPGHDGADRIEVRDPSTGTPIARIVEAGPTGVGAAVEAGTAAFNSWRRVPARERGALVGELARRIAAHADELARLDWLDTGNPLTAMRADVTRASPDERRRASPSRRRAQTFPLPGLHYTKREPWGVVGRMITFNHPSCSPAPGSGPALVAGNAIVMLKPSELAPLATLALAELTTGLLPDGLVYVVMGGPATGAALVRHPSIRRLSFTGSTATALRIQAAAAEAAT